MLSLPAERLPGAGRWRVVGAGRRWAPVGRGFCLRGVSRTFLRPEAVQKAEKRASKPFILFVSLAFIHHERHHKRRWPQAKREVGEKRFLEDVRNMRFTSCPLFYNFLEKILSLGYCREALNYQSHP